MKTEIEPRKWILVVDDNKAMRESIKNIIKTNCGNSVRIVEAHDGIDATSKINQQRFHCIITDIEMPKKEGEAFISTVRQNSFNELTPVIVVSGVAKQQIESKFPFVYFFSKPFDSLKLIDLVKEQLKTGSNKGKLSVGIVNDVVHLASSFLEKIINTDTVKIGQIERKEIGSIVNTDYVSIIEVKIGKVKNTFSILSKKEDLEKIVSKIGNDKTTKRSAYSAMNYTILKQVLAKNNSIDPTRFSAGCINSDASALTERRGIVIPLEIEDIKISIFATVGV